MAYPGLGFDPTPGEAAAVDGALTRIGRGRRQVEGCAVDLRGALRAGGWTGPAAAAYGSSVAELPRALDRADRSLDRAGLALETWLRRLLDNQREASRLDARARALRGSPDLEGELRRTLDAARRLRSRHVRQAAAAAAALRAGVWVWESAAEGVAVAAGQVSGWTGQVAWLGASPGVGGAALPGASAGLSGGGVDLAGTDLAGAGVPGRTDPAGAGTEAPGRTHASVRVDLSGGRVVDLPMTGGPVTPGSVDGPATPAERRTRSIETRAGSAGRPGESRAESVGQARSGEGRAVSTSRGRQSEDRPAARAVQDRADAVRRAEPTAGNPAPHRDRPAQPVPAVVPDVPRTHVGATPTYSPEPVDQHVQASAVTAENAAPVRDLADDRVGRPVPAPGIAAPGVSTPGVPTAAPAGLGMGPLGPGTPGIAAAEPGHRPPTGAPTQPEPADTDPADAALLIAAAGIPSVRPASPTPTTPTPTTGLGVYLVCCGTAQVLVLAEECGDTVRRTMFLSAS